MTESDAAYQSWLRSHIKRLEDLQRQRIEHWEKTKRLTVKMLADKERAIENLKAQLRIEIVE